VKKPGPRRAGGFIRAGEADLYKTGMPRRRALELRLHHAWRQVAGRELAGRLRPVRIVRGCLELEFLDSKWNAALREMLPSLVARLAGSDGGLGIRKFRVLGEAGGAVSVPGCGITAAPTIPD
jgi:hypothetical protein